MRFRILMYITAMAVFAALAAPIRAAAQDDKGSHLYQVTNLGTLGGTFAVGNAASNKGWVAGGANLTGDTTVHAFLWTKQSGMTDLGTLGGPDSSVNWPGISDRGQLVGVSDTSNSDPYNENFCAFGSGLICLGFSWKDGVMTPLATLGGNNGYATGVNNRGQIAGFAETSTQDPNCIPADCFTSVLCQAHQYRHHLRLETSCGAVAGNQVQARFNQPGSDAEVTTQDPSSGAKYRNYNSVTQRWLRQFKPDLAKASPEFHTFLTTF